MFSFQFCPSFCLKYIFICHEKQSFCDGKIIAFRYFSYPSGQYLNGRLNRHFCRYKPLKYNFSIIKIMSKRKVLARIEKEIKLKKSSKKKKLHLSEDSASESPESQDFSRQLQPDILKKSNKREMKLAKMKEKYKKLCKEESKLSKKKKKNSLKHSSDHEAQKSIRKKIKQAVQQEEEKRADSEENSIEDDSLEEESEISEKEENQSEMSGSQMDMDQEDISSDDEENADLSSDSSDDYNSKKAENGVKLEDQLKKMKVKKQESDYQDRNSRGSSFARMAQDISKIRQMLDKVFSSMGSFVSSINSKEKIQIKKIEEDYPLPNKKEQDQEKQIDEGQEEIQKKEVKQDPDRRSSPKIVQKMEKMEKMEKITKTQVKYENEKKVKSSSNKKKRQKEADERIVIQ